MPLLSDDINATCTQCDCMVRQARSVIMNVQLGASPHSGTRSMGASVGCNLGVIIGVIMGVITFKNYTRTYGV